MTFVHPLLLGGLVLVGIPVLIHLIMRQKPKHLLFPAFRFLLERHRSNQRKLHLRHLLLLALRMLILAAICLALARPKMFSERFQISSNRPRAAVFVIDTSYSMEYTPSGGRSRLEEAKRRAQELLDELPPDSRVAVLDTAEPGGEWLPASMARERIAGLQLRAANYPVTSQFTTAYDLLARLAEEQDKPDEAPLPFLYVFSDRTEASWDSSQLDNLKRLRDRLPPPGVNATYFDIGVPQPADLAIVKATLDRQSTPAGIAVVIHAAVGATGTSCDTVLTYSVDGETSEKKEVKLDAGQSAEIVFQRSNLPEGLHQAVLKFEAADKALPFNNTYFVTFEVRPPRKVLTIADEVDKALDWQAGLESGRYKPEKAPYACVCDLKSAADAARLSPKELAEYKAVCLFQVAEPSRDLWEKLAAYVDAGGGLAVVPSRDESSRKAYNSEWAQRLLPGELVKVRLAEPGVTWNWTPKVYQHALLAPFQAWNRDPNIAFVRYPPRARRYWEVKPRQGADVLITYADGEDRPALLETRLHANGAAGKVLLFTTVLDGLEPKWNDYREDLHEFYVVVTQLPVSYLAGDVEEGSFNYWCGQSVPVALPPTTQATTYTVQGPGLYGAEALIQRPEKGELHITRAVQPGNYKIFSGSDPVAAFSLNVPPEESQLTRIALDKIEALLGPNAIVTLGQKANLHQALQSRWSQPLELFPWLMILLLLVLVVENLLANKFYRREPADGEAAGRETGQSDKVTG